MKKRGISTLMIILILIIIFFALFISIIFIPRIMDKISGYNSNKGTINKTSTSLQENQNNAEENIDPEEEDQTDEEDTNTDTDEIITNETQGTNETAENKNYCSNETSNYQCSTNKPLYCLNKSLINNCSECGCPSGKECQSNGNCIEESLIFTLYLAPNGDDQNSGLTKSQPIKTLVRSQEILKQEQPQKDVEIRIKSGTYSRQYVHPWNYYNKDYSISFMPEDHEIGTTYSGELPIFDGEFIDNLASDSTGRDRFFIFYAPYGENTNINFYYLKIKRYINGISLEGSCSPEAPIKERSSKSANNNKIIGNVFEEIGNGFTNSETLGTQALSLWNSQNNLIEDNTFSNLKNTQTEDPYQNLPNLHGIYVMCNSKNNIIRNNYFNVITGDPIRFRDYSGSNIVEGNTFVKAGFTSFVTDWYNDNSWQMECPSFNNIVRNNEYACGHWPNDVSGRDYNNLPLTYTWPTGVDERCILSENRFIIENSNTQTTDNSCSY